MKKFFGIALILASAVITIAASPSTAPAPNTGKSLIISGPPSTYVAPTKAKKPATTGPSANQVYIGMNESEIPRVYKEIYKRRGISILEIESEYTPKKQSYYIDEQYNIVETWNVIISNHVIVDVIYESRPVGL